MSTLSPRDHPELDDDATDEEVREFAAEKREELEETLAEHTEEREESAQQAMTLLGGPQTDVVTFERDGRTVEIEVLAEYPRAIERQLQDIGDADVSGDASGENEAVYEFLAAICQTDGFDTVETWRAYHEAAGQVGLVHAMDKLIQPYADTVDALGVVEDFRGDE